MKSKWYLVLAIYAVWHRLNVIAVFVLFCRIHMAPFSDEYLYVEIANKVWSILLFVIHFVLCVNAFLFFCSFILGQFIECSMLVLMKHLDIRVSWLLYAESENVLDPCLCMQALFWQQQNYYGVDLTALHGTAFHGYFSQVCLGCIHYKISQHICHWY